MNHIVLLGLIQKENNITSIYKLKRRISNSPFTLKKLIKVNKR